MGLFTKKSKIKLTLETLKNVCGDACNFVTYILYDKGPSKHSLYSKLKKPAKSKLIMKRKALTKFLSKSMKKGDKEIIRLKHAALLLYSFTKRESDIAKLGKMSKIDNKMDKKGIENYLLESWDNIVVKYLISFICDYYNEFDKNQLQLKQIIVSLMKSDKNKLLSDGLYGGYKADDIFLGQMRQVVIVFTYISTKKTETLKVLKKEIVGKDHNFLTKKINSLKKMAKSNLLLVLDVLPESVEIQARLLELKKHQLLFLNKYSIHATDGLIKPSPSKFSIIEKLKGNEIETLGFIRRAKNEIGSFDLVKLNSTTRGIKFLFLPWLSHYITKMVIPSKNDVNIFFTAAINGCSVFVTEGGMKSKSLVVYHAGISTTLSTAKSVPSGLKNFRNDPATFWRKLLCLRAKISEDKIKGEVNRNHYVKDTVKNTKSYLFPSMVTTPHARAYEKFLAGKMGKDNILKCNPWGCVMGFRDTEKEWSFYLQENVSLIYQTNDKEVFKTSRPIYISKIYPIKTPSKHEMVYDGLKKPIPNPFIESLTVVKD